MMYESCPKCGSGIMEPKINIIPQESKDIAINVLRPHKYIDENEMQGGIVSMCSLDSCDNMDFTPLNNREQIA